MAAIARLVSPRAAVTKMCTPRAPSRLSDKGPDDAEEPASLTRIELVGLDGCGHLDELDRSRAMTLGLHLRL